MRVADYIFRTLADRGAKHVFLVTGGGAMHLNDALRREKRLRYICCLHEQACAMAAEGYARIAGSPGIVSVTTGPGGTNALTGVLGAWVDSIPMLVISGQVKRATTIEAAPGIHLRQLGDQEINIIDIVRPITKYAVMVRRPEEIVPVLDRAWEECRSGRPGPVWIDVPLDIQAAELPDTLRPGAEPVPARQAPDHALLREAVERLRTARRPVIVAGNGVTLAGAREKFRKLMAQLHVPVLTTLSGIDLLPSDSPVFFGRPGILGERGANFILQNADLLLVIGTRMSLRIIGYDWKELAREAYRVMVDADPAEMAKPTFRVDCAIPADAGAFLTSLAAELPELPPNEEWLAYCRRVRRDYPVVLPEHRARTDRVSSYVLPEIIGNACRGDEIIVTGNGTAYTSTFQVMPLKPGMRMFANVGCASMGYGLPAAIGAALAGGGRSVICLTGDGSIQMNLQELQTVLNLRLPLKLFVYNNDGYLSIKLTQNAFFGGERIGSDPGSGVVLPNLCRLAAAYGWPTFRLCNNREAEQLVPEILAMAGPVFCEVLTDPLEQLGPKAASKLLPDGSMVSCPLEDLAPFLPREEFRRNMLIPPVDSHEM